MGVSGAVDEVTDNVSNNLANAGTDEIKGYESDFTKSAKLLGGKKRRSKGKKAKKTVRKTHGKKHNKKHGKKSRKLSKSLSNWIMHVKNFAKDHIRATALTELSHHLHKQSKSFQTRNWHHQ